MNTYLKVKNKPGKEKALLFLLSLISWLSAFAQVTPDLLSAYIAENSTAKTPELIYKNDIADFYKSNNYQLAWCRKENADNLSMLMNTFKLSPRLGLRETDYQYEFLKNFSRGSLPLLNEKDSITADIRIADAALHFYSDVAYGNSKPPFNYTGINHTPRCRNISALLAEYASGNKLRLLLTYLSASLPEVAAIENKIWALQNIINDKDFNEVTVTSRNIVETNRPLIVKLYQLGLLDSIITTIPATVLVEKVKETQRQFSLQVDGVIGNSTLRELNVPLSARVEQLAVSINYYRWLYCLAQNQSVITVNIPAAFLKVYNNNDILLQMRMIVGKQSTPTPTLISRVDKVILYPYWHVPYSIATKELLPAIKRNPGYIDAGNYQVLNNAGKIMDPYSINWGAFSTSYFPYTIRQSTGCDNALGLIKLDFSNPFSVYLHDTPNKSLFMRNRRYFSHGCMRMEKPMEMGKLILKSNNQAIDTLTQMGCLLNQKPIYIDAEEKMPVIVWYNPAGTDSTGRVIFYEDVYKKFR